MRCPKIYTNVAIDANDNVWFGASKFSNNTWTDYTTTNSNIQNDRISAIAIDKQGTKWFGSYSVVSKFNDTIWTNYNPSNSSLPAYSEVTTIAIDSQGTKWFGTEKGTWIGFTVL